MNYRSKVIPLLAAMLIAALTACGEEKKEQQAPPPAAVSVAHPVVHDVTEWDEFSGRFRATERVEIRPRVSGYLTEIRFEDGQMVKRGDVLFIIDQRPFQYALEEAQSNFASAQAQRKLASSELERAQRLSKQSAISTEDFEQRQQQKQAADAAVQAAKSELDQAKLDMEFTRVTSPIDGRVSRHFVDVGNLVNGNETGATLLTTVVALDPIHFYFEASETDLLRYARLDNDGSRPGSRTTANPVKVKLLDEEQFVHEGTMDFVDNEIDEETGTIEGRAVIPNPDGLISPGMFARVRLIGRKLKNAILVPDSIISVDQSRQFVLTLEENNTVGRKFVEPGEMYNQKFRVIRSGLSAEDTLILDNTQKARPGAPVNPEVKELSLEDAEPGATEADPQVQSSEKS